MSAMQAAANEQPTSYLRFPETLKAQRLGSRGAILILFGVRFGETVQTCDSPRTHEEKRPVFGSRRLENPEGWASMPSGHDLAL